MQSSSHSPINNLRIEGRAMFFSNSTCQSNGDWSVKVVPIHILQSTLIQKQALWFALTDGVEGLSPYWNPADSDLLCCCTKRATQPWQMATGYTCMVLCNGQRKNLHYGDCVLRQDNSTLKPSAYTYDGKGIKASWMAAQPMDRKHYLHVLPLSLVVSIYNTFGAGG